MKVWVRDLVLAAAAAACLIGAPAATAAAKLSIEPSEEAVFFGKGISIEGELTPDAGVAAGGHEVRLYEKPYPYRRSKVIATTTTGELGRYSFPGVEPQYNSRYRVAIGDETVSARSSSKLIVVFPEVSLDVRATRGGRAESAFGLRFSSKLPIELDGRRVLWYFHRIGSPRFVLRDRGRAREARDGLLGGRSSFDLPPGRYRFQVTFCIDLPDKRDIGLGAPTADRDCPRSFPARTEQVAELRAGVSGTPILSEAAR